MHTDARIAEVAAHMTLFKAAGITDGGQIVADGKITIGGVTEYHAFPLTPIAVPLPAVTFLLVPAVDALGFMRRRAS